MAASVGTVERGGTTYLEFGSVTSVTICYVLPFPISITSRIGSSTYEALLSTIDFDRTTRKGPLLIRTIS